MKILLFENGQAGQMTTIPGENVKGEVEELLGGEVVSEQLNNRLMLYTRKHGDKKGLPVNYTRVRGWKNPAPICGNAVVVRAGRSERASNITEEDAEDVNLYVQLVE